MKTLIILLLLAGCAQPEFTAKRPKKSYSINWDSLPAPKEGARFEFKERVIMPPQADNTPLPTKQHVNTIIQRIERESPELVAKLQIQNKCLVFNQNRIIFYLNCIEDCKNKNRLFRETSTCPFCQEPALQACQ